MQRRGLLAGNGLPRRTGTDKRQGIALTASRESLIGGTVGGVVGAVKKRKRKKEKKERKGRLLWRGFDHVMRMKGGAMRTSVTVPDRAGQTRPKKKCDEINANHQLGQKKKNWYCQVADWGELESKRKSELD